VLPDAADALEAFVPSPDATEDPREASVFLGGSATIDFPKADVDGFFFKPRVDGLLTSGRGARVLDVDWGTRISGPRLSGLGVLERAMVILLGGGIP
jgi:hypothetical protein